MMANKVFTLRRGNIYALPIVHYNMEMAAQARMAFLSIRPECVAVELAETMEEKFIHAATRLPDISIISRNSPEKGSLYYMCEPCDAAFEGLRSALEENVSARCIDLDVDDYPKIHDCIPDPYAIERIGLQAYYTSYRKSILSKNPLKTPLDQAREFHMAKRLKELSLQYDTVLFISGMFHTENVLDLLDKNNFPASPSLSPSQAQLSTLTEESCREVMNECGWYSKNYEEMRKIHATEEDNLLFLSEVKESSFPPDRQKLLYTLYKESGRKYQKITGNQFPSYLLRNTMKFVRNYALIKGRLMPNLFQTLSAAKACVEHNYAYEVWELSTTYPYRKNIDNLPELNLSAKEIWGNSKILHFHLKEKSRKQFLRRSQNRKDQTNFCFDSPGPLTLCSYPPEDLSVENFGDYLKKKGTQILSEESSRTIPFTTSLEDGIDTKETIRNWYKRKIFVKTSGKPPGGTGSVVVIFDEDLPKEEGSPYTESFPWMMTWLGEHQQESDMAFYATDLKKNIIGPGISRCEYGGFMMSYPPRRMYDIWMDPDYANCQSKSETLLAAAIDYSMKPLIVYVAAKPPRNFMKSFARRFNKRIVYIPIGQMSPILIDKLRIFHVLNDHNKRDFADEYIF